MDSAKKPLTTNILADSSAEEANPTGETPSPPLSTGTMNASLLALCPSCGRNTDGASVPRSPQLHPNIIPTEHTSFDNWMKETNVAIKSRLEGGTNNMVKALLLTWKDNDLGSKAPEQKGSLLLDETEELERVFRANYGYETRHYDIPSDNSEALLVGVLSSIITELQTAAVKDKKRPLLIVYYNGHAFRSKINGHFMLAA